MDRVDLRFSGPSGSYTVYIDDLVLFNYTAFDEAASVSQTFTKPFATSGRPNGIVLRYDVEATPAVNLASYFQVAVNGSVMHWDLPLDPGTRSVYIDLSSDIALRNAGPFLLDFSLQLTRTGTEEASMAVWLDNVTIVATDYQSGTFTAVPWTPGGAAVWGTASLTATTPTGTGASVETRSGNTSNGLGPSWTGWQPLGGGSIQSPPNRYLQWRLQLTTLNGSLTPLVTRLAITYDQFLSNGVVRTARFLPPEPLVAWRQFLANDTRPPGTRVTYELSMDNGSSWSAVVDGQNLAVPKTGAIVRANLLTVNASVAPTIRSFSLRYEYFGPLYRIDVRPTIVTLTADQTADFTATALDQFGHALTTFGCTWVTNDPGGTFTGDGNLTGTYYPHTSGSHHIWCFNSDQSIGGEADVTVSAGALASIVVTPMSSSVGVAREKPFAAQGLDADGNAVAIAGTVWSSSFGLMRTINATAAIFLSGTTPGGATISARVGAISGEATCYVTAFGIPVINGTVPDQFAVEDGPTWQLDLTAYARGQSDPRDTLANLSWELEGADPTLYSVTGTRSPGVHKLGFTPMANANGRNTVKLWLVDMDGARSFQFLNVTIEPANDAPTWAHVPEVWVKHDTPYRLDLAPYVDDIDTPKSALTISTDDPAHIAIDGLNATYTYPGPALPYPVWAYHYVSDGVAAPVRTYVAIHVTDDEPPHVKEPPPDVTMTEDVKAIDVFAPKSLSAFFDDTDGEDVYLSYNFTNLDVQLWDRAGYVQVNMSAAPDFCGLDRVTFRATDPEGAFAEWTIRVTVVCVNDPPVLDWTEPVYIAFNVTWRLDLSTYIWDVDNPTDELTLTTGDPEHAAVDGFVITFLYTHYDLGPNPSYDFFLALNLADRQSTTSRTIHVFVSDDRPPELTAPFDPLLLDEDFPPQTNAIDLARHFLDYEDGTALAWSVTNGAGVRATLVGSDVTLISTSNWNGVDRLVFRATDTHGGFALGTLSVEVAPIDDPPAIRALPDQVRGAGTWVIDLRPYVSDVDNNVDELTFATNSAHVVAVGYLLVFDYPDRDLTEPVTVTVRDPGGLTDMAQVRVQIVARPIAIDLLWPWSGLGVFALAAAIYLAWTRLVARKYSIEDLFLIGREGRLIMHTTRRLRADRDSDILTGMLTAIMLFVRDSFREEHEDLKRFEFGDRKVAVERGDHVIGAAIFGGDVPEEMSVQLRRFVTAIEDRYAGTLGKWSGDVEDLPGLKDLMEDFGRRGRWRAGDSRRLDASPAIEAGAAATTATDEGSVEEWTEDEL